MSYNENYIAAQIGADARDGYPYEVITRVHKFLDQSEENPKLLLESFKDYWLIISCTFNEDLQKKFNKVIFEDIENLLYSSRIIIDGEVKIFTEKERNLRKLEAFQLINMTFMDIHRQAYLLGLYMPVKKKLNPKRAIADYYD